jgi:hypothetical protein
MDTFIVGEELNHRPGDPRCPACVPDFPEPCRCGGLMHASLGNDEDLDGDPLLATRCDQCGRSEDDLAEAV